VDPPDARADTFACHPSCCSTTAAATAAAAAIAAADDDADDADDDDDAGAVPRMCTARCVPYAASKSDLGIIGDFSFTFRRGTRIDDRDALPPSWSSSSMVEEAMSNVCPR
jgi:hypothetical protein